jgi:hypothetical protein
MQHHHHHHHKEQNHLREETESSPFNSMIREPHRDIFTEADLQVKIADLGNSCWTVNFLLNTKIFQVLI